MLIHELTFSIKCMSAEESDSFYERLIGLTFLSTIVSRTMFGSTSNFRMQLEPKNLGEELTNLADEFDIVSVNVVTKTI